MDDKWYWSDCPIRVLIRNIGTTATYFFQFNIPTKIVAYNGTGEITNKVDRPVAHH